MTRLALTLGALTFGLFLATSQAQDAKKAGKEPGTKREISPSAKSVIRLQAAYELAAYGRENKLPEVLIAAARVIGTADVEKGEAKKAEVQKEGAFDSKAEAEALLKEAIKLAEGNEAIKNLAAEVRKSVAEQTRGPRDGRTRCFSGYFNSTDDPDDNYSVDLRGGEWTSVSLISHTGTDLDLEIYASNGALVARQNSVSPNEFYRWFVSYPGEYRFRVINYNPNAYSRYTLTISR